MAASAIPWDKIFRYGPLVVDTAGKALDRVMKWRSASVKSGVSAESKDEQKNTLTLEQLSDAVAEQAKLTKQLAEQVSAVSCALSGTYTQFEVRTNESLERIASEVSSLTRRSRVATAIAGVSILLTCALAVVLALR
jgi:hypothetical protein